MKIQTDSLWHYQHVSGANEGGREWRISDDHRDEFVAWCETEAVAASIVKNHNAQCLAAHRDRWPDA